MNFEKSYNKRQMWKAITAIVLVVVGAGCFALSTVVAMITVGKE